MILLEMLQASPGLLYASTLFLGLCIGSFMNVVISRLPRIMEQTWQDECAEYLGQELADPKQKLTLSRPASHCPSCKAPVRVWQNIPVISYLLLRGKCANCKTPISLLYPTVELTTGLLSLIVVIYFGWSWQAAAALILTWALVPLTVIDLQHQLLPDSITLPLLWIGLLLSITGIFTNPVDSILGAVLGYMSLWIIYQAFRVLTGKEGMGYGDFKLFAVFGAWLGWQSLPMVVLLSSVVGTVVATLLIVIKKLPQDRAIPFGPFIAGAGWLALIAGDDILNWYWRVAGL